MAAKDYSHGSEVIAVRSRSGHALPDRAPDDVASRATRSGTALGWFGAAVVLTFAVAFVGADRLELHHDLYYLIYFTVVGTFLVSFVAHTGFAWSTFLRRNIGWSLLVGAVLAVMLVQNVTRDSSTTHPTGAFFAFEILWRGVAYGTTDALILFVFPAAIAWIIMRGDRRGARRKIEYAALTLGLSSVITAGYHLGYGQFRGSDLVKPEIGALVAWIPAALTGNPIGAVLAHAIYHISANIHVYRSGVYLPPALHGYAERAGGALGLGLAAAWLLLVTLVLTWQRHRLFPAQPRRGERGDEVRSDAQ